ncbi:hypothetical protein BBK36DRAFT_1118676 [Trichoderma citrinoviride]|uniref:Uncharacterized protein n=1 Tax=Trichoderma citrinoviride TaxID=58853 RepID=A0A2T4BAZ2_9HYPO|nr:hypothetical protein BBK36DRAFT_1118676 [Trichoderma citrinoviride]PTB66500.1 hypothetical protein BBK36DRAFT_1118676 [Trichoderma citrinoviride]
MARNAPRTPTTSQQHPPSSTESSNTVDSQFSTRIFNTNPNTSGDPTSRKKLKSCPSAERSNAAVPLDRPRRHSSSSSSHRAPVKSDLLSRYNNIDPHMPLQGGAPSLLEATTTSPTRMRRQQAGGGGGDSSDRLDWAPQPGLGKDSSLGHVPRMAPSNPGSTAPPGAQEEPLLTQHAPGERTSKVDDQNITSLSRGKASERGLKRRLPIGEAEAEFSQKRLLDIVQDLDKLERETKDFGKQQLQAIREGFV